MRNDYCGLSDEGAFIPLEHFALIFGIVSRLWCVCRNFMSAPKDEPIFFLLAVVLMAFAFVADAESRDNRSPVIADDGSVTFNVNVD